MTAVLKAEIEAVPLQRESTHGGGNRTAFEFETIIFPKLFFSRNLCEKLHTKGEAVPEGRRSVPALKSPGWSEQFAALLTCAQGCASPPVLCQPR